MRKTLVALLVLLSSASPAFAHSSFGSLGPFWVGALHIAVSPLSLVSLVGLGASLAAFERTVGGQGAFAAVAAAVVAAWIGGAITGLAPIGAIVVGLVAASGFELPTAASIALGIVGGIAGGAASNIDSPDAISALGAGLAVFLVGGLSLAGFQKIEPLLPMARRVVGAWVAAIGLLLGALALRG